MVTTKDLLVDLVVAVELQLEGDGVSWSRLEIAIQMEYAWKNNWMKSVEFRKGGGKQYQ